MHGGLIIKGCLMLSDPGEIVNWPLGGALVSFERKNERPLLVVWWWTENFEQS